MKKINKFNWLRNVTAFCMAVVMFSTSTMFVFAKTRNNSGAEITVTGQSAESGLPYILLNGEEAISGRTFLSGGALKTTETTSATIELGNGGVITLAPNSSLNVNFSENSISGTLMNGQMDISAGEGINVNIKTPDSEAIGNTAGNNSFSLDTRSGTTKANVKSGAITFNNGKGAVSMKAQDDDDDDTPWVPVLIFAGIVGGVTAIVLLNRGDDEIVSPVR